jgi:hypothetical protein
VIILWAFQAAVTRTFRLKKEENAIFAPTLSKRKKSIKIQYGDANLIIINQ